jgi:hypothetical protein
MIATSIEKESSTLSKAKIQKKIKMTESKLKKALGLYDDIDINDDPIAEQGNGNHELIKKSLSLQKSLQSLVKVGLGDKSEVELMEDIFEAIVVAIDEQSENTLNGLLDAMFENNDSKSLMSEKTKKSLKASKMIWGTSY